jgi:predicted phage baseplate assembly protein
VGTHARFVQSMQARLATMDVDGVAADGQTVETFRPLQALTTRAKNDFSIALLDGWATVGDVLTFYQERIANEGFLRTATERRSVLELSRLIGYTLRPGVAATAYLAYTLDDNQVEPVTIAASARSQSIPGPDEQPQFFETSEDLFARREWNNLQVRLSRPPNLTQSTALGIDRLFVAGTATNLKKGDRLLLVFADDGAGSVLRTVLSVDTQFADNRTAITLQPVTAFFAGSVPLLAACLASLPPAQDQSGERRAMLRGQAILNGSLLGLQSDPLQWVESMRNAADVPVQDPYDTAFANLERDIKHLSGGVTPQPGTTTPDNFVKALLRPPVPQVANTVQLPRALGKAFQLGADVSPQLLLTLAPPLRDSYYKAWTGSRLTDAQAPLKGLFVMRTSATLFGSTASKLPTYSQGGDGDPPRGTPNPPDDWREWQYELDEQDNNAFLDDAIEAVTPGSYVVAIAASGGLDEGARQVMQVKDATTRPRTAYALSGKTTALTFTADWRVTSGERVRYEIGPLRQMQIYAQSEPLTLLDTPITDPVETQQIPLDRLYEGLVSGRWVILSGERADIDAVAGVRVSELQMISGLKQDVDPSVPGDRVRTILELATKLAYRYRRDTLVIHGNVVKATHGATNNELLGSGDGAASFQSFTLKQPPLTFVAAPTAAGAESTLHVYVNNVEWHEIDSFAGLGPKDRRFITATDDAGNTSLTFGNGQSGARLPSGTQNVTSVYRTGIGAGGNVKAGQISLLQTRPLGVKEVINPLRASGGAGPESRDLARENAPLSVMALDRLVSTQDFADFTRRFAGIAKALALRTTDGQRQLLYLTIAGADDAPIDPTSDLYRNLLAALYALGDEDLPIRVDMRELQVLVLSARIKLLPDYRWEPVASGVRAKLLAQFGFGTRALGQWALLSEVISAIQGVAGVAYVDVNAFGAIPEKKTDVDGTRRLLTQSEISAQVQSIVNPLQASGLVALRTQAGLPPGVSAWPGGLDTSAGSAVLRPAELAIFVPSVSDTLILNQIL